MSGWENVAANGGVSIAIGGMTIVFCVLALISGFISILPKVLDQLPQAAADDSHQTAPLVVSSRKQDEEIAAAIGFAMQMQWRQSK